MKTITSALLKQLIKTLSPVALTLLLSGFWSAPALAADCPGGVSEESIPSVSHTINCNVLGGAISSSVTVTKNGGLYQLTDLSNATAADAMGSPVALNDVLTDGTCYTFTSTGAGTSGAEYQGTMINAVGFADVGAGACSGGGGGGGGFTPPDAPAVTSDTTAVSSDYVVSGTHPVDGTIITVVIDANLNNLIDIEEPPATGPVVVSGGSWATAPISISGDTRFLVVANDPISGLPSSVVVHQVSYSVVDSTPPSLSGVAFEPSVVNLANQTAVSFSLQGAETGTTASYRITSSGGEAELGGGPVSVTEANQTIAGVDVSSLSDGTLTLSLTLADGSENRSEAVATIQKDATAPAVTAVAVTNGFYNAGDSISLNLTLNDAVTVTGSSSTLTLVLGDVIKQASFVSASGSSLTYRYTVQAGDNTSDSGVVVAASGLSLNGSTIKDSAGNDANLEFTRFSNSNAIVDTVAPSGYSASITPATIDRSNEAAVGIQLSNAEAGATYTYSISSSGGGTAVTGSGTVSTGSELISGINITALPEGTLTLTVTLTDAAGNSGDAKTATATKRYAAAPVVTQGEAIAVSMSEDGAPDAFSLTLTATDANSSDTLSWSIKTAATEGEASVSGTGNSTVVSYVPATDFHGTDSFEVQVSDGALTDSIVVNVTVQAVNDAPVLEQFTGWQGVGGPGFSAGVAIYTSLALAADGTPYLAYVDTANGNKATVMKFNAAENAWQNVGDPAISAGRADYISLALAADGTPYLAYQDAANGNKATVMNFTAADNTWRSVGGPGISASAADSISLVLAADGTPYLAYRDAANLNKATVMKFNAAENIWQSLGPHGISAGTAPYTSLALASDGTPYLAYLETGRDSTSRTAAVMKFTAAENTWQSVGIYIATRVTYTSLALAADGTPYLAYSDGTNGGKATVMKFNAAENTWQSVGNPGISAGIVYETNLALAADGTPYLAYRDAANGSKATVLKFNAAENKWSSVGSPGISAGNADYISLALAADGTPYLAYRDIANDSKATVMTYRQSVLGGTITLTEDSSGKPLLDGVTIADIDSDTVALTLTLLTPSAGTLSGKASGAATLDYDPETGKLTLSGSPTDVNASLASIVFIPAANYSGRLSFTLELSDGDTTTNKVTTSVVVTNVNDAPTITGTPETSVNEGSEYKFTPEANDVEADTTFTFSIENKPDWASFDSASGALTGIPDNEHVGKTTGIMISVSDGKTSVALPAFDIEVVNVNDAPGLTQQNDWQVLEKKGFSTTYIDSPSLALTQDGTPYLAYANFSWNGRPVVMSFNAETQKWQSVGGDTISEEGFSRVSVALDAKDLPYVLYRERADGAIKAKRFINDEWLPLGAGTIAEGEIEKNSIAVAADGTVYIAYYDAEQKRPMVQRFTSGNWQVVGGGPVSESSSDSLSLVLSKSGIPYVAYRENTGLVQVKKLSADRWQLLGAGSSLESESGLSLALARDGKPYLALSQSSIDGRAVVLTLLDELWAPVSDTVMLSDNRAFGHSLVIAADNLPYYVFSTMQNSDNGTKAEAIVQKFNGSIWEQVGTSTFEAYDASLAIAVDGSLYLAYPDRSEGGKATVMKAQSVALTLQAVNLNEDGDAARLFKGVTLTDVDSDTVTLTLTLSDSNSGILSGTAAGSAKLEVSNGVLTLTGSPADVNASLASIVFTPAANFSGNAGIRLELTDGTAAITPVDTSVVVTEINDVPVFTAVPDQTLYENQDLDYELDLSAYLTDADGDELALAVSDSINQLASSYSVNGMKLQMSFDGVKSGSVAVKLTAADGKGGSATKLFKLTVIAENDIPVTKELRTLELQSNKSDTVRLADYISDEESSFGSGSFKVSFSSAAIESEALKVTGPVDKAGIITVTSLKNAALTENIQIIVSDNSGKDPANEVTLTLPVQVNFVNRTPELTGNCQTEQTAYLNEEFRLDLTKCITDPDGDRLDFFSPPVSNWLSIVDDQLVGTPPSLHSFIFPIKATDTNGAAVTLDLNFQILNKLAPDMNAPAEVRINATSSPQVVQMWQLLPGLTKDSTVGEIEAKKRELVTSGTGIPMITKINGSDTLDGKAVSTLSSFSLPPGLHFFIWQLIGTEAEASEEKWQFVSVVPQMTVSLATETVKYNADLTAKFELLGSYPQRPFAPVDDSPWYRLLGTDRSVASEAKKVTGSDCEANFYQEPRFLAPASSSTLYEMSIGFDKLSVGTGPDPAGFTCTVSIPQDYENKTHATISAKATILPSGESRTTASSSTLSTSSEKVGVGVGTVGGVRLIGGLGYLLYSAKAARAAQAAEAAETSPASNVAVVTGTGLVRGSAGYAARDTLSPVEQTQSDATESYSLTFVQTEQGYELQLPEGISPGIYQLSLTLVDEDGIELQSNLLINAVETLPELDPNKDSDGDGLSDSEEGLADSNGNGIADYLDNGLVRSHLVLNVGEPAVIQCPTGTLCALGPDAMAAGADGAALTLASLNLGSNYKAVGTVVDFVVRQLAAVGSSVPVVVPSAQPIPAAAVYLKFNNSQWSPFVEDEFNQLHSAPSDAAGACPSPGSAVYRAGLNAGDYCIQLTLQDGGPNDADGMANGEIFDPGVLALQGNQLPELQADVLTLKLNSSAEINLLANDTDPDGDTLTLVDVQGFGAEVEFSADGLVQLTAPENFVGTFGFTYRVQDSQGAFAESTLEVTVSPNTLPVGVTDSASTTNKVAITIDVLSNDTDADGDRLVLLGGSAQQGHVQLLGNQLRYVPKGDFVGQDRITYTIADQWQAEAQGTVQVTVSADPTLESDTKSGGAGLGGLLLGVLAGAAWRRRSGLSAGRSSVV